MSRSASKIRDGRSSLQREIASLKARRSVSVDTRARGSYVPEKKRTSSEERKSGNKPFSSRWGGARKSSITLSEAKRKDMRPLTDKAYQKKKICELVEFLEEIGFNSPISTSKLMSPSKKDFENIFQYLYKCFDQLYEVRKIEEEGPKILKNMGYPFSVNKSAFVYVARTNWPTLLGVLIWLMDLNKFVMKVDMKYLFDTAGDDERAEIHKILLRLICQCHHSGTDNEEEENAIFIQIIKSCMSENLDEIMAKNEEKKLLLASVENEIEEIKNLTECNAMLETNMEKYEDYISKMKSHYQKKDEVCVQLLEDLKVKESELKVLHDEVSKKQDAYDVQGFDGKKHRNFFEIQKKELAEKLRKKQVVIKELQDKLWESEIQYTKDSEKATAAAESFRDSYYSAIEGTKTLLQPLQNIKIPQVQKLCSNFHLDFPVWEVSNKHVAESDKARRNDLEHVIDEMKNTNEILKRICSSLNQKLNEIEIKKSEFTVQLKLLCIQESKNEQDLNSKKKLTDDEISSLEAQCEKIAQSLKTFEDEKSQFEKQYKEMAEELIILQMFQKKKKKQLKDHLKEQKEMFNYFERNKQLAAQQIEVYGNEIAAKLEELKRF